MHKVREFLGRDLRESLMPELSGFWQVVGVLLKEIDPELRSVAASAYGALNLPSQKVKDLILDQARS